MTSSLPIAAQTTVNPIDRDALIASHMLIVQRIVGKLMRSGQRADIERDELLQAGYLQLVKTIDRGMPKRISLEGRIARDVETAILRAIRSHQRYGQRYRTPDAVENSQKKADKVRCRVIEIASDDDSSGDSSATTPIQRAAEATSLKLVDQDDGNRQSPSLSVLSGSNYIFRERVRAAGRRATGRAWYYRLKPIPTDQKRYFFAVIDSCTVLYYPGRTIEVPRRVSGQASQTLTCDGDTRPIARASTAIASLHSRPT